MFNSGGRVTLLNSDNADRVVSMQVRQHPRPGNNKSDPSSVSIGQPHLSGEIDNTMDPDSTIFSTLPRTRSRCCGGSV